MTRTDVGGIVDEAGSFAVEPGVEFRERMVRRRMAAPSHFSIRAFFQWLNPKTIEKLGVRLLLLAKTISAMTARAPLGVSDAALMRQRRCSTMPEMVCTMVVKAATGPKRSGQFRWPRFSAERSIFCRRLAVGHGADVPESSGMARVSAMSREESSR